MMQREEERGLIRRARQGDTAAFGEIIRRYQYLVYATTLPIVKDPLLAEDVAQEAFVSAFRSLTQLRTENYCGCGCVPPGKKLKRNVKAGKTKPRKKRT